mmetsp:Transcript_35566/g.74982  ORF Transcript_35566/g.74982 Transcript_35566/m.74982 type:complete len:248 (+) Transcript_35566:145-888(+)|eukprot:CAMPEP_0183770092 /NCGR_PEP_ID=MMETSP0739-20130205/26025_1 /TAXON_ID=385413 /ORGANISM="Thalassiosira miniscula, Strain CCMP1093" /LENGTH=247 /DNA_ID=CAMNT_0026009945 /DNA_START=53 /DNA_END=796 /DNA_ORIENTATION=+
MGKKSGGRVRVKQMGAPKMPANPLADLAIPPEEMIHLPPKPDSNSGVLVWPMNETFTMTFKNFSAIYPNYLDSDKTVKMGRRIAAKDALPEPTIQDIHEALVSLNIRHAIQPHKGYSRDASSRWDNPGRVMVDLEGAVESGVMEMKADGAFDLDDAIPEMGGSSDKPNDKENKKGEGKGKKQLLRQLAQIIRDLPSRKKRLEEKAKMLEEEKLKAAKAEKEKAATKTGGSSGGGGGGNRKKKGKKKK